LQPIALSTLNANGWTKISKEYMKWQFPNCIGALDGRHMEIKKPPSCFGSQYYNYKNFFSMMLLAVCDANHKFIWVDIG